MPTDFEDSYAPAEELHTGGRGLARSRRARGQSEEERRQAELKQQQEELERIERETYEEHRRQHAARQKAEEKARVAAEKEEKQRQNDEREATYRRQGRHMYTDSHGYIQPSETDEEFEENQKAEAATKERNSRLKKQYRAEKRPFYMDDGKVVATHDDETWQKMQEEAAAEKKAKEQDARTKEYRRGEMERLNSEQGVQDENDSAVSRALEQTKLKTAEVKAKNGRIIDAYKKQLKEIEDGTKLVNNPEGTKEHLKQTIAEAERRIQKAEDEQRAHEQEVLDWRKQEDLLKSRTATEKRNTTYAEAPEGYRTAEEKAKAEAEGIAQDEQRGREVEDSAPETGGETETEEPGFIEQEDRATQDAIARAKRELSRLNRGVEGMSDEERSQQMDYWGGELRRQQKAEKGTSTAQGREELLRKIIDQQTAQIDAMKARGGPANEEEQAKWDRWHKTVAKAQLEMGQAAGETPAAVTREQGLDQWKAEVDQDSELDPEAKAQAALDLEARKNPEAYEAQRMQQYEQAEPQALHENLTQEAESWKGRAQQHQAEMETLNAEASRWSERLDNLQQRNEQRMSQPHRAADLVPVEMPDGTQTMMFKDLAAEYEQVQSRAGQWQQENSGRAHQMDLRAEELERDRRLIQKGAEVLKQKQEAAQAVALEQQRQAEAERKQQRKVFLENLESAGMSEHAQALSDLDRDMEQRRADVLKQYPEGSAEREAALKTLAQEEQKQTEKVLDRVRQQEESAREKAYHELNQVPGAEGAGDELAALDREMQEHLGGDDDSAREYYARQRQEILDRVQQRQAKAQKAVEQVYGKLKDMLFENDVHAPWWSSVTEAQKEGDPEGLLTGAASTTTAPDALAYEQAIQELTEKLGGKTAEKAGVMGLPVRSRERQQAIDLLRDARASDWGSGDPTDPVRYDSKGNVLVNPDRYLDPEGYKQAVEESEGNAAQKAAAMKAFPELQKQAVRAKLDTLRTTGVFRDWERKQDAEMSDADKLAKFEKDHQGFFNSDAWKVRLHQALFGIGQSVVGLAQSGVGLYESLTRSREAMDLYKKLGQESADLSRVSQMLPTGQWVNFGSSMVMSTLPSLAVGGVAGAARGQMLERAAKNLTLKQVIKGGKGIAGLKTAEQAAKAAEAFGLKGAAAAAGLQSFGTMYGNAVQGYLDRGKSEDEALNLAWAPAVGAAAGTYLLTVAGGTQGAEALLRQESFKDGFKQWFNTVVKGSLKEGLREEAPDQLLQGMLERHTFNPGKTWSQIGEETMMAGVGGALMGGVFEGMNTRMGAARSFAVVGNGLPSFAVDAKPTGASVDTGAPSTEADRSVRAPLDGISGPAAESARAIEEAYAREERLRQSPAGGEALRADLAQRKVDPRLAARESGEERVEMPKPEKSRLPELQSAAEAQIALFDQPDLKREQIAQIKDKARVIVKIAQGAEAADLTDEELRAVGLNRDGSRGHYEMVPVNKKQPNGPKQRVWVKGEGQIQPVLMEDGKLIISQRQIDNFRRRLPAVADVIGLSEVERRQALQGKAEPKPKTVDEGRGAPMTVVDSGLPESGAGVDTGAPSNEPVYEQRTERSAAPGAGENAAQSGEEVAAGPRVEQARGGETAGRAEETVTAAQPELEPEAAQRAREIAVELERRGLGDQAQAVAEDVVRELGVRGENYAQQMIEPEFGQALRARGWRQVPASKTMRWERADTDKKRTLGTKPAAAEEAPSKRTGVGALTSKTAEVHKPLIEREDWQKAKARVLSRMQEAIKRKRDKALGSGKKTDAQKAAADELRAVIQRMNKLEELVDTKYGPLFDGVVLVQRGTGGGMYAQPLALDAKGRATAVALEIDLDAFMDNGAKTEQGMERTLNEELSHRVDLMVSSREEAIELAQAVHAARPGVFNAAWKHYFAVEIHNKEKPSLPPKTLSDDEAYMLYFEATRIIHQGSLTTENSELPEVGVLKKLYLYFQRWLKTVRAEMRKLPKDLREEWEFRIDRAESLIRQMEQRQLARERAALEDVEPPVRAGRSARAPVSSEPDYEAEMAQEADEAMTMTPEEEEKAKDELATLDKLAEQEKSEEVAPGSVAAHLGKLRREGVFSGGYMDQLDARYYMSAAPKRMWDAETKRVQDGALSGIFKALYGNEARNPTAKAGTTGESGNDGRGFAGLARRALEREMGKGAEAVQGEPTAADIREQGAILADWARENGLLLTKLPAEFTPGSETDAGQMEHHLWPSEDGKRVVKLTRTGQFGLWPVAHGQGEDLRAKASTPLRYLKRVTDSNAVFGDDIVLHGVLINRQGGMQLLTSQPSYEGDTPGDLVDMAPEEEQEHVREQQQREIQAVMQAAGFEPVRSSRSTYYRAADNTAVFDAHLNNVMWVDTDEGRVLQPFDVVVMKPAGKLRENLEGGQVLGSGAKRKPLLETMDRIQEWMASESKSDVVEMLPEDLRAKIEEDPRWTWLKENDPSETAAEWYPEPYRTASLRHADLLAKQDGEDGLTAAEDKELEKLHDKLITWELEGGPWNEVVKTYEPEIQERLASAIQQIEDTGRWKWNRKTESFDETGEDHTQVLYSGKKRAKQPEVQAGVPASPVDELAHEAATSPRNGLEEPTAAQKEAGNYRMGHVRVGGHEISIENPAGSKRRPEWPALKDHYGYLKSTHAHDGDHVDVFVKPGTPEDYAGPVHVVRQVKVENGKPTKQFDEYKVMLGYPTAAEARAAYLRNYEPGWPGMERMTTHSAEEFKRIKDRVFTVKPKDVPRVRESDAVLASGAKRAVKVLAKDLPVDVASEATGRAKGVTGATAGAAIGGLVAGPVGAAAGAAIGATLTSQPFQGPLAKAGSNNLDRFIYEKVMKPQVWDKVSSAGDAVKVWLNQPGMSTGALKWVLDQTVPLWNTPREYLAAYHEMQRKTAWGREKAMDVVRALSHEAKVSDLGYPQEFVEDPIWRVRLFDAMEGKEPMEALPPELQAVGRKLRGLLEETGRELVKQGLMNLDTFNELTEHGWMPRFTEEEAQAAGGSWIQAFKLGIKDLQQQRSTAYHIVDTTRKDASGQYETVSREEDGKKNRWRFRNEQQRNAWYEDFVKREAVKLLQGGGKQVTDLLSALSKDDQKAVREEITRLKREDVDLPAKLSENLRNVVRRAVELQRLRFKKENPFEPDKLIKDPVYAVARYVMAQTHNAATMELLRAVAKKPEWVSDVGLAGFTEMPDNPRFGPLAKKWLRDDIAQQVKEHVGVDSEALKWYDSLLRKWKSGKLVLNPGSHIRDALGNTVFAYLGGNSIWNPGNLPYYRDAIRILRDGGPDYAELIEQQVLGGDAMTTQVKQALKGLLPDTQTVDKMDASKLSKLMSFMGAGLRGTYQYLSELRQVPDDFYKTAAYQKYKAQGMSPEQAAAEVRKWFPYYDRLGMSGTWKFASRVTMPFSSFFRESTRVLGRAAMERPLALATSLAFASAVTKASLMMLGLGEKDEEAVKRSMRGKMIFTETPVFSMLLPMRTSEGQLQQWDLSAVLPFADLLGNKVEGGEDEDAWTKFWRKMFTGSPILSTWWSWSKNIDAFTGQKIVQEDMGKWESTKERLKNLAGDLLPPLTPGVGVHYQTLTNAGRRTSSLETRNRWQSYVRAVLGLDVRSADPNLHEETRYFRQKQNLPLETKDNSYATPLKRRLGKDIKNELIQDEPDVEKIAEALARLDANGTPIKNPKQMGDLLDSLDPAKLIKKEYRQRLIQSFSPEGKRVYQNQQREYLKAQQRVPQVLNALARRRREMAGQ